MKKNCLTLIIVLAVFSLSMALYFNKVLVLASEISEETEEVIDLYEEYNEGIEDIIEDQQEEYQEEEDQEVLTDELSYITEISPVPSYNKKSYSNTNVIYSDQVRNIETSQVNESGKSWQFDESRFRTNIRIQYKNVTNYPELPFTSSSSTFYFYAFKPDRFGEHTEELINNFSVENNFLLLKTDLGYAVFENTSLRNTYDHEIDSNGKWADLTTKMNDYFNNCNNNNTWQGESYDFEYQSPDPDPDPDPNENGENEDLNNNDQQYHIMVIFCFGLCLGSIIGHFLTGFIK